MTTFERWDDDEEESVSSTSSSVYFQNIPKEQMTGEILEKAFRKYGFTIPRGYEDDREVVTELVDTYPWLISRASSRLQGDKEMALSVTGASRGWCRRIFGAMPDHLRDDPEILWAAAKADEKTFGSSFEYASERLMANQEFLLHCVASLRDIRHVLEYTSEELKADRAFIMTVIQVTQKGWVLKYASGAICNDREVVLTAVSLKHDLDNSFEASAFWRASTTLQDDREIVLKAVSTNGLVLGFVPPRYQNDPQVVAAAVRQHQRALQFASDDMRNDRNLVLEAVSRRGYALEYASERLQSDREIVMVAVSNWGSAIRHASEVLRGDRQLITVALNNSPGELCSSSEAIQNDRELVLVAVKRRGRAIGYASKVLQNDRELALLAVTGDGSALQYVSPECQANREIVLAAVSNCPNGESLQYASDELRKDRQVVITAIAKCGPSLFHSLGDDFWNEPCVVTTAISNDCRAVRPRGNYCQGSKLKMRMANALQRLHLEAPMVVLDSPKAVLQQAELWRKAAWQRALPLFLLIQDRDAIRIIIEFSDAKLDFQAANDLVHTAPVIGAYAKRKVPWQSIDVHVDWTKWSCWSQPA